MFHNYYQKQQAKANQKIFVASLITGAAASFATWLTHKDNRKVAQETVNNLGTKLQEFGKEAEKQSSTTFRDVKDWAQDMHSKITQSEREDIQTVKVTEPEDSSANSAQKVEDIDISKEK